nr:MAG: ORF1 [TTV-like mini virus]
MAWITPYYSRWRRYRFWPRRSRRTFRWRRRRRRYRVRPYRKKKPNIILRQWQPACIRKCHIKGLECLMMFNEARLPFNSVMYKESTVPPGFPGGGGFVVMKFTLENLYDMHQHCYNWWTNSNQDLPLCRYLGCRIRCYRSELIDYIIKFDTNLPGTSNKLTYPSTQPSMIMMSTHKHIITSRQTNKNKKPYKTFRIPPPAKLENKWYFQKDLRNLPLLIIHASAASLTKYYINPTSENNNITLYSINTQLITNRDFRTAIWPHKRIATKSYYIYEYTHPEPAQDDFLCRHVVPLTNIREYTQGSSYTEANLTYHIDKNNYCQNILRYCGNPFVKEHRETTGAYYHSEVSPTEFAEKWKNKDENAKIKDLEITPKMQLTKIQEPIIEQYRYNPFTDTGNTTAMYLLKCDQETLDPNTAWENNNLDVELDGFPLWLNIWGFVDFQIRLGAYQNIMTNTLLVLKSQALKPTPKHPIVLIDSDYFNNKSPYEDDVNPQDRNRWYPQLQYQTQEINKLALTGPGVPKLYPKTSDQITIEYDFLFKWGGEPAKMINVDNPSKQIVYPMPSDQCKTTSLQSPAQAIESTLYTFDQRYDNITNTALERLQRDWNITNILSSITETAGKIPETTTPLQKAPSETTQKEEKEALLLQLIEQQHKQQQLRFGILQLMKQLGQ